MIPFLSVLSRAMNAILALDPASSERLSKLQGKTLTIELLPFHFIFHATFTEEGVAFCNDTLELSETKITGTPLQMMGMMREKKNRQSFFAHDLRIEGNAELGQEVVQLFDELQIDLEEYLAKWIGDTPAYHLAKLTRRIRCFLSDAEKSLTHSIDEYLHEESGLLPPNEALDDFFHDIDLLRMDVDRFEASLNQLSQVLSQIETRNS